MFVVWALLGMLLGGYLGITAARTQFPQVVGIIAGFVLGAVAFVMFYGRGVTKLDLRGAGQSIPKESQDLRKQSPYAGRRCPKCTDPNDSLTWQGTIIRLPDEWGDFVGRRILFVHRYTCIKCGYDWQFESPLSEPDKPIRNRVD